MPVTESTLSFIYLFLNYLIYASLALSALLYLSMIAASMKRLGRARCMCHQQSIDLEILSGLAKLSALSSLPKCNKGVYISVYICNIPYICKIYVMYFESICKKFITT
jgi:hypothetical protein